MTGIPSVTIRAWERRYEVVRPSRTDAGYRVYDDDDVADLHWLKARLEERGMSISQAASQLRRLQEERRMHDTASQPRTDVYAETGERLLASLQAYRPDRARAILELGFSMYGYEAMIGHVLSPLFHRAGEEWASGRLTVAQEHYITEFVMQRCMGLFGLFPIDDRMPRTLAYCPSGERHQMGLLLFSLYLRHRGVDVLYLGADTPNDGIAEMIREAGVSVVAVSFADVGRCRAVMAHLDALRERFPSLTFVVGGRGAESLPEPYSEYALIGRPDVWAEWFEVHVRDEPARPVRRYPKEEENGSRQS